MATSLPSLPYGEPWKLQLRDFRFVYMGSPIVQHAESLLKKKLPQEV